MLVDALLETATRYGGSPAVADQARRWSYRQLTAVAIAMQRIIAGGTSCDRVGILLPASTAFPATLFGALWALRTAVPLNFLLSAGELRQIVLDAGIDTVFSVHHFEELVRQLPVRSVFLEDLPLRRRVLLARLRRRPEAPKVRASDTAVLLYTSGTSGAPKGVELSYGNLRDNCEACIEAARMDRNQTFLNILPPFHAFGLTTMVLTPVVLGAAVYAIPRFNPAATLEAIREQKISIVMAVPSMYAAMLRKRSVPDEALASIYLAISGGEVLPEAVAEAFEKRFGVKLHQGYGLTETSPVVSLCAPHAYRRGSVGRVIPGFECRIVDARGTVLPAGQDGEVQVRGPCVMKGYYQRPEETAAVIDADGWLHTGDIGKLDADGYLFITGRKKEMMIVGGENVSPGEIENVLVEHPAVAEAAVIGVPDASRGEVPVAFVTLSAGAQVEAVSERDLRNFARRHLAGHKVPHKIRIAHDLPRGPTGKVLKRRLTELL